MSRTKSKVGQKKEPHSVSLPPHQKKWIKDNNSWFNYSKWVVSQLDAFISQIERMKK